MVSALSRVLVVLLLIGCPSGLVGADDVVSLDAKEKAHQAEVAATAAAFAKAVAGDESSETYSRVLMAAVNGANEAVALQKIDELEKQIKARKTILNSLRGPSSSAIRPTTAAPRTPLFERSISRNSVGDRGSTRSIIEESVLRRPRSRTLGDATDFAPRQDQAQMPLFDRLEWRKNMQKLIAERGTDIRPRIFNPNDDESRPVTDLRDCVAIGQFDSVGQSCCSGTLIAPNVILTAAHCVPCDATSIYVGYNSNNPATGKVYEITSIIAHEDFNNPTDFANDLAIIALDENVDGVAVRALATTADFMAHTSFTVVGFGDTDEGNFGIKLEAPVALSQRFTKEFTAGGSGFDSCQGDSGGPIYLAMPNGKFRLAGVTSRGAACGTGGVYTRVDAYQSWIEGHLANFRNAAARGAVEKKAGSEGQ
jgi:V8-like Glu-specific endopeptidase